MFVVNKDQFTRIETMRASELRSGDYVYPRSHVTYNGTPEEVIWGPVILIDADKVHFSTWDVTALDQINPIKLTEDWLLKFGFKLETSVFDIYKISKYILNDFFFSYASFGGNHFKVAGVDYEPPVYVHQLQNLFLDHTGIMLTFSN